MIEDREASSKRNYGLPRFNALVSLVVVCMALDTAVIGSTLTLAWDSNSATTVTGYKVYAGTSPRDYSVIVDAVNATSQTFSNAVPGATYFFAVTAYDASGQESEFSAEISYTVPHLNTAPTISVIPSTNMPANGSLMLVIVLNDGETPGDSLIVTGSSSNQNLVPDTNILFFGSRNERSIFLSPADNQVGTTTITLVASDGQLRATNSFTLAVEGDGPTAFGNTGEGTAIDPMGASWINACRHQAAGDLVVTTIVAKVVGVSGRYKCAIYADANTQPGDLLTTSVELTNTQTGWQSFSLDSPAQLRAGTYYWLAIWSDDPGSAAFHSGNAGTLQWGSFNYGPWPSPLNTSGSANVNYCIYAAGTANTRQATLDAIAVTPLSGEISPGDTIKFAAKAALSDGSTTNITDQVVWSSSNTTVATVDANGTVTALSAGTTIISATLNAVTGVAELAVRALTIGNLNDGVLLDSLGASWVNACRYQATGDLRVTKIYAKVGAITGRYQCAIYTDNSGQPGWIIEASHEVTNVLAGWHSFELNASAALANGQFYWLAIWSDDSSSKIYYSDTNNTLRWGYHPYGVWPNQLNTSASAAVDYCIYAVDESPLPPPPAIDPEPLLAASPNRGVPVPGGPNDSADTTMPQEPDLSTAVAIPFSLRFVGGDGFIYGQLTWKSVPGATYQIAASDDRFEWTLGPITLAKGPRMTWTDAASSGRPKSYRVLLIP